MKLIDNKLRSFQVTGRLPQWAVWVIAVALFGLTWLGVGVWARATAMRDLATHTDHWDEEGILQQETNYTCVPASIVMLLRDAGIESTTYEAADIAGTDIRGTGGAGIMRAGEHYGFDVIHERMDFDEFMSRGLPAIVILKYKGIPHAAYVKPIEGMGAIEVKDPIQGLLYFYKEGADEYFGMEEWDVYLFE